MKRFLKWLYLGVILFLLLILIKFAFSTSVLSPGSCFFKVINVTENMSYYEEVNVCADNATVQYINLTMQPGEIRQQSGSLCNYDLFCRAENISTNKCVITGQKVNAGETFRYNSAYCEVEVESKKCPDVTKNVTTTETKYTQDYHIMYSNASQRIQFNFGTEERVWNVEDNVDIKGTLTYTCPVIVVNDSAGAIVTAEQCKAISQIYCGSAFDLMVKKFEEAEARRLEYETNLENCRRDKLAMVSSSVCISNEQYATLQAEKMSLRNQTDDCSFKAGGYMNQTKELQDTQVFLVVIIVIMSGIIIWLGVKYKKATRTGIPKEDF